MTPHFYRADLRLAEIWSAPRLTPVFSAKPHSCLDGTAITDVALRTELAEQISSPSKASPNYHKGARGKGQPSDWPTHVRGKDDAAQSCGQQKPRAANDAGRRNRAALDTTHPYETADAAQTWPRSVSRHRQQWNSAISRPGFNLVKARRPRRHNRTVHRRARRLADGTTSHVARFEHSLW